MSKPGPKEEALRALREMRPARARRVSAELGHALERIAASRPAESSAVQPKEEATMTIKTSAKARKTTKKASRPKKGPAKKAAAKKVAKKVRAIKAAASGRTPARDVAEFIVESGDKGVAMAELVAKFGIEAHPMRAKIHYCKHTLGYAIESKGGRYHGELPKKPTGFD